MPAASQKPLYLVLGLGSSGLTAACYLAAQGYDVVVNDSRANPPHTEVLKQKFPFVKQVLGGFDEQLVSQADQIIISPGISHFEPIIKKCIAMQKPLYGDVELFARRVTAPVIAITGTNGKSTVTELLGEMAKKSGIQVAVGGNLGTPVLELISPEIQLYILEISSFQLDTTESLAPLAATILNISPDHLDRYINFQAYIASKQRIYRQATYKIYNADDPLTQVDDPQALSFTLAKPQANQFGIIDKPKPHLAFGDQYLLACDELQIKGQLNWANALSALALGYRAELPMSAMLAALKTFRGLAHRCQWIRTINGIDWINDSKGTNVGASCAAITSIGESIKGKVVLIAGGQAKQADFTVMRDCIREQVRVLILIGEDADRMAGDLDQTVPIVRADSLQSAVKKAQQQAQAGDSVLLSPACASFDMFNHFAHRGEVFTQLVQEISE